MRLLNKLLLKCLGRRVRIISLTENEEQRIIVEMGKIEGIADYWELQRLGAYQLYAKTDDKKYLGIAQLATTMTNLFHNLKNTSEEKEEEERSSADGYESEV